MKNLIHRNKMFVLIYIVIAATRLSITLLLAEHFPDAFFALDSNDYIVPAKNFLELSGFLNEGGPEIFRTPGYSIFLTPGLIMGVPIHLYASIAQLVLLFVCAFLSYKITRLLTQSETTAHISSLLVLFTPEMIIGQHYVLSEMLFSFLLILFVYCILLWMKNYRLILLALGMLLITASIFVRPIAFYLPYFVGFYLIIAALIYRKSTTRAQILIVVGLMIAMNYIAVEGWKDRNMRLAGTHEFATVQSVNMNEYIAASIAAKAEGRGWEEVRYDYRTLYYDKPISERESHSKNMLLEVVIKYPLVSGGVFLKGLLTVAADPGVGDWLTFFKLRPSNTGIIYKFVSYSLFDFAYYIFEEERLTALITAISLVYIFLLWSTFIYGLRMLKFNQYTAFIVLIVAYFLIFSSGPQSIARFRMPIMPLILVFSAVGLSSVITRMKARHSEKNSITAREPDSSSAT